MFAFALQFPYSLDAPENSQIEVHICRAIPQGNALITTLPGELRTVHDAISCETVCNLVEIWQITLKFLNVPGMAEGDARYIDQVCLPPLMTGHR